ncbi:two-component system, NarL family, sensor histidine kinase UhpB [Methylophilus rhizosphaerae]|uniref:histidine kinase n=1 Tax=Methylophilus rhizosphaerae TaxID=492660 RepID=A0A1G9AXQ9_9PROT|nr:two-component system, NarL family, sensor histidine kinase UhpB [Methylophilus rhizosphaerae]
MLSLAFLLAAGVVLVRDTRDSIRERVEAATRVTVQLLDTVIVSSAMNPSLGPTHYVLQDFLNSLGYVRSSRIELYDYANTLLYVSPHSTFQLEIDPPQWFVKLVSPKVETVTRRVRYGTLIITSSAEGSIREAWSGFLQLIWMGIGFFVLLNLLVYGLLSHALRPVQHILRGINQIEQGDLTTRLPRFSVPEFDRIGASLNQMAVSLDAERQLEQNRQLTQLIQQHIEDERRSLARELHDELGQYVTAIKTFAVAIVNKTREKSPDIAASAQTIVAAANHIYDGMHNIIRQLRPAAMDNMGLIETLRDMIAGYQAQHPELSIQLHVSGEFKPMGENVNINIYRIVQEAVNNAIKHADARSVMVRIQAAQDGWHLRIEDDGVGMQADEVDQTQHFGLLGIRERVQALHGQFKVISEPGNGQGAALEIRLPLQSA